MNGGANACTNGGPDSADGFWSVYFTQTLNGHSSGHLLARRSSRASIRSGTEASRRSSATSAGARRTTRRLATDVGDFFQLQGRRQRRGADLRRSTRRACQLAARFTRDARPAERRHGRVHERSPKGDAILLNTATIPQGRDVRRRRTDERQHAEPRRARLEGQLAERRAVPSGEHAVPARVRMKLSNLTTAAPASPDLDKDPRLVDPMVRCRRQRVARRPAPSCANGGANFTVYAESTSGGAIQC